MDGWKLPACVSLVDNRVAWMDLFHALYCFRSYLAKLLSLMTIL